MACQELAVINWCLVYNVLKDWQTLIAGILAFSGAWATLSAVRKQINSNRDLEISRKRDEEFAARAVVPLALSSITEYAETCLGLLRICLKDIESINRYIHLKDAPRPPDNIAAIIRDAIRFTDDENREKLSRLLSIMQIHNARMRDARIKSSDEYHVAFSLEQLMIDSARLWVAASNLFSWARQSEKSRIMSASSEDIWNAFMTQGLHPGQHPDLDRMVLQAGSAVP